MTKYFIGLDDESYKDWKQTGQALQLLHLANTSQVKTIGGGFFPQITFHRILKHHDLDAGISRLVLQYRHGLPINELETKLRNLFGQAGFPQVLETAFIETYAFLKKKYKCATFKTQLVISNVNQGQTFTNNCWPLTGESALAWGVRELWIQGLMFWISHHYADKGLIKFPALEVFIHPLPPIQASGTIETHPSRGKPWMLLRTYAGIYDSLLDDKVTPDELVINKFTQEIILTVDGKLPYEIQWDEDEIFLKPRHKNDTGSLLPENQCFLITDVLRKMESITLYPITINWYLIKNQVYITSLTRDTQDQPLEQRHLGLNILAHGQPIVQSLSSGPLIKLSQNHLRVQAAIVYVDKLTPDTLTCLTQASGVVVGDLAYADKLRLQSFLTDHGIPSIFASLTHLTKIPPQVTLDGQHGHLYAGNFIRRQAPTKIAPLETDAPAYDSTPKIITATTLSLSLPELTSALPDLDNVSLLSVNANHLWKEIDTHPEYLKEHHKLNLVLEPLVAQLLNLCLNYANKKILFNLSALTSQDWLSMKFGKAYESAVSNPDPASKYLHSSAQLECELNAIKELRHKHRITNLWIQIPQIIQVDQLIELKKYLSGHGLSRSASLHFYLNLETPLLSEYLLQIAQIGLDGIVIDADKLLTLYSGNPHWQLDQYSLKFLAQIISEVRKHHLNHILTIDSRFDSSALKQLIPSGLAHVQSCLSNFKFMYDQISQAEQSYIHK